MQLVYRVIIVQCDKPYFISEVWVSGSMSSLSKADISLKQTAVLVQRVSALDRVDCIAGRSNWCPSCVPSSQ